VPFPLAYVEFLWLLSCLTSTKLYSSCPLIAIHSFALLSPYRTLSWWYHPISSCTHSNPSAVSPSSSPRSLKPCPTSLASSSQSSMCFFRVSYRYPSICLLSLIIFTNLVLALRSTCTTLFMLFTILNFFSFSLFSLASLIISYLFSL